MVLDLEEDITNLKAELEETKQGGSYWWKKWQTANDAIQEWMNKWRNAEDNVIKLESLWRNHLDESDPQDDNEWEAQARQILWNASDTEKQIEAEGYDRDDRVDVLF